MKMIRMFLATICLVVWCIVMPMIYFILRLFRIKPKPGLFFLFHKGCCRIFGITIIHQGELCQQSPTLYLANHVSYLDIFILGSLIPGHFIAKSEVAKWPILGKLAGFQNTLFFERKGTKVRGQVDVMTRHFQSGGNLILFPEGTSTAGDYVMPFKSSLLKSVEDSELAVHIQPISIIYTHYRNKPMSKAQRDVFAWYDVMPFASHFFNAMGHGRVRVEVIFHKPCAIDEFECRKACANHCFNVVEDGLKNRLASL